MVVDVAAARVEQKELKPVSMMATQTIRLEVRLQYGHHRKTPAAWGQILM
jgi:hypothetical protein